MTLSTGTRNLKFMQRGAVTASAAAGPSTAPASSTSRPVDPAQWVLPARSSAKGKGKAKADQDVEFEGSYLPFLEDEEAPSAGRRTFGMAPKPVQPVAERSERQEQQTSVKAELPVKAETRFKDEATESPPKTFLKPAGFDDVESKPKLKKAKRKSSTEPVRDDEVVQGARAKKKPKKKVTPA